MVLTRSIERSKDTTRLTPVVSAQATRYASAKSIRSVSYTSTVRSSSAGSTITIALNARSERIDSATCARCTSGPEPIPVRGSYREPFSLQDRCAWRFLRRDPAKAKRLPPAPRLSSPPACGCSSTARVPAFQAGYAVSITVTRSTKPPPRRGLRRCLPTIPTHRTRCDPRVRPGASRGEAHADRPEPPAPDRARRGCRRWRRSSGGRSAPPCRR